MIGSNILKRKLITLFLVSCFCIKANTEAQPLTPRSSKDLVHFYEGLFQLKESAITCSTTSNKKEAQEMEMRLNRLTAEFTGVLLSSGVDAAKVLALKSGLQQTNNKSQYIASLEQLLSGPLSK
ncbi:MAG: hypothetical protein WD055_00935 [Candidatus Dependentiae bacterium]